MSKFQFQTLIVAHENDSLRRDITLRSGKCSRYSSIFNSVESTSLLWKSSHKASQSCRGTYKILSPLCVVFSRCKCCFNDSDLSDGHNVIFSMPVGFVDFVQRLRQVDGSLLHPCNNTNNCSSTDLPTVEQDQL